MDYQKFLNVIQKSNNDEMEQIKDKLHLIKSSVCGENIFIMMEKKNPPMKAFKLCIGIQLLYNMSYNKEHFTDLE